MRRALALALACSLPVLLPPQAPASVRPVGPPAALTQITFAPGAGSTRVYATSAGNFWRSDDKGLTWTADEKLLPSPFTCTYSVSPVNEDLVYAGNCQVMSRDGGRTWISTPAIDTTPLIDAAGTLYSSEYNVHQLLHRCTPDISSCSDVHLPGGDVPEVDPASAGLLVDGLFRSADGGSTWTPIAPPPGMVAVNFSFDGRTPGKLLAAGRDIDSHELFAVSLDAGLHWGSVHPVPLPTQPDQESLVQAGGSGALRRIWISSAGGTVSTADDGATFQAPRVPGGVTVDPSDGTHVFAGGGTLLYETRDAGASWTLRNAPQYGYSEFTSFTGSGSTLYAVVDHMLWSTHDMGLTWTPVPALADDHVLSVLAWRDDPQVAYALGAPPSGPAVFWQTTDGGATWAPRPPPPYLDTIDWIQSGHPNWVRDGQAESHDGGATWTYVDSLHPFPDPAGQITEYVITDPATGARFSTKPFGRYLADGTIDTVCAPGESAPCRGGVAEGDAWVADGHTTLVDPVYGGSLWAMRDGGRWYRIRLPAGASATQTLGTQAPTPNTQFAVLSHSYFVTGGLLVQLTAPALEAPTVTSTGTAVHCATPLNSDDADLSYVWRRDGAAIAGETALNHVIAAGDHGRSLTCVLTAANAWGSSTATSAPLRIPGTAADASRLALGGAAVVGNLLRCGAASGVTWLRDGHALRGAHAPTHRVSAADEGHALACRARGLRSASLAVPRAHGGHAVTP